MDRSALLIKEEIDEHREAKAKEDPSRVVFQVAGLYGISPSTPLPVSATESIESGPITLTLDPEASPSMNLGVIDYEQQTLTVRYGAHFVFPGLFDVVQAGRHDPSLLSPVRVTATDDCTLNADMSGWHAVGCLDFLPGSLWAGAEGG